MKKIAFLTYDLNIEYCHTILQGVSDFFEKIDDTQLIISQVKSRNDKRGIYVYQYNSAIELLTSKDIDGYILLSTSFNIYLDEIIQKIRSKTKAPIISIGMDLPYENCYSTLCDTKEIYKELIGHLIHEHKCKKIGYFTANETGTKESQERFDSYKKALEFYGLAYNEDYVLHGNFTRYRSKQIISEKYKSKEDIPFDSILCANDLTATGCIEEFTRLGLSIPDEMIVIGFDNSSQASLSDPSISTVSQQIVEQGYLAARLIYEKTAGKEIQDRTEIPLVPVYRQSCGCIELKNKEYVYKDKDGNIINQNKNYREYIKNYYDKLSDSRNVFVIFDIIHSNDNLQRFYNNLDNLLRYSNFKGISVCLYDNPVNWDGNNDFSVPDNAKIVCVKDLVSDIDIRDSRVKINPLKRILPKELDNTPGLFLLQSVYNCKLNYGYFVCHFTENKIDVFSINSKIINQAIAQAAELSRTMEINHRLIMEKQDLEKTNSSLAKQSKTDELTKILNRRGFMEYGQQQINLSISMNVKGAVFFADLDGLKHINDTFGHKMGDKAIQCAAKALRLSFRKADIIGRLSGDEFAVVAPEMPMDFLEKTRAKLDKFCQKLQKQANLPFTLSLSLGGICFTQEDYYLKELLIKADKSLYEEKEKHHKRLNF